MHAQQVVNVFRLYFVDEIHFFRCHEFSVVIDVWQILESFLRQCVDRKGPVDYPMPSVSAKEPEVVSTRIIIHTFLHVVVLVIVNIFGAHTCDRRIPFVRYVVDAVPDLTGENGDVQNGVAFVEQVHDKIHTAVVEQRPLLSRPRTGHTQHDKVKTVYPFAVLC